MKDLAKWQGLHKMQAIVTWKEQQCTRISFLRAVGEGEVKRKNIPFESAKRPVVPFWLLFCYKATDMNEVTAKRSNKDTMMQLPRRAR